jgi:hypothetical protein
MPLTDFTFDSVDFTHDAYDPFLWRGSYQMHRYLVDLTDEELNERYSSLLRNKAFFSSARNLQHKPYNHWSSFWYWARREEETEEEFRFRRISPPSLPLGVSDACRNVSVPTLHPAKSVIVRFGKDSWLRSGFEKGQFRLKHACGYLDSGLNDAQRDDELTASMFTPGRSATIIWPDGSKTKPLGKMTYQRTTSLESYILCATTEFDPWLFHYFEGDACLVIHDLDAFRHRIDAAFNRILPGYMGAEFCLAYIDEHNSNAVLLKGDDRSAIPDYRPILTKSFRFAYQKEFRFVWGAPPGARRTPAHISVEVGSLRDIASYYVFDAAKGMLTPVS